MFTVDEQSGMSWFRPCSLEPMYKFEMVGLLFSLAIYNGLTLPVNFPLAFYRKLQGYEVTNPSQIRDGWPTLARGLQSLLDWSDGDVGDVFARTYDFTAEGPGFKITVDMEKNGRIKAWVPAELNPDWCCRYCSTMARPHVYKAHDTPVPPPEAEGPDENGDHDDEDNAKAPAPPKDLDLDDESVNEQESETAAELPSGPKPSTIPELSEGPEGVLVTNANREQYVSDYVFWLTNKSIRPQFQAFADNFYTCISTRAPSILDVRDFKRLVEGSTHDVSVSALESIAQYDGGYHPDHPTIKDFWDCVRDFAPGQIRSLLEFVTASDRIPATGWASVQFSVQKNGEGDERLPTSLTCYGRLLLPMYSGKSVLREKLGLAIENSKGFGVP